MFLQENLEFKKNPELCLSRAFGFKSAVELSQVVLMPEPNQITITAMSQHQNAILSFKLLKKSPVFFAADLCWRLNVPVSFTGSHCELIQRQMFSISVFKKVCFRKDEQNLSK